MNVYALLCDFLFSTLTKAIGTRMVNFDMAFLFSFFIFSGVFDGRPADYLFMLIFNWLCLVVCFMFLSLRKRASSRPSSVLEETLCLYISGKFRTAQIQSKCTDTLINKYPQSTQIAKFISFCIYILVFSFSVFAKLLQVIALAADIYFLLEPMVLSVLYVWCQLNRDMIVQFWFGTQFKVNFFILIVMKFLL